MGDAQHGVPNYEQDIRNCFQRLSPFPGSYPGASTPMGVFLLHLRFFVCQSYTGALLTLPPRWRYRCRHYVWPIHSYVRIQ